jgi:hypothetical protein
MLNVILSLTLIIGGVWAIPASYRLMDGRAAKRKARKEEFEQQQFERRQALHERRAAS